KGPGRAGMTWVAAAACGPGSADGQGALAPAACGPGSADGQGVLAADAGAEPRDVRSVDVQRYRHAVAGVAHPVDVAGRGEAAHLPGRVLRAARPHEAAAAVSQLEQLLLLGALEHAE